MTICERVLEKTVKTNKIGYFFSKIAIELIVYVETDEEVLHFNCNKPKYPDLIRNPKLSAEKKSESEKAVKQYLHENKHEIAQKALLLYRFSERTDKLHVLLLDLLDT